MGISSLIKRPRLHIGIIAVAFAVLIFLDVRYELFPRVLIGGTKIILSAYIVAMFVKLVYVGLLWCIRSVRSE